MPLIAFVLLCRVASAQPAEVHVEVSVGFAGLVVPGAWVPLRSQLTSTDSFDGMLVIDVPDVRGSTSVYRYPLHLLAGVRQELRADLIVADPRHPLVVRVMRGVQEVGRQEVSVGGPRTVDGIVLALTHDAAGLEFLTTLPGRLRAAYVREDDLPVRWQGYEGVVAVVMRDLEDTRLLPVQRQALHEWIAQGGRLVVTGTELLRGVKGSWLDALLPATVIGVAEVRPSELFPRLPTRLTTAVVRPRSGASVRFDRPTPLVVERGYGRGTIVLWAFDAFAASIRGSSVLEPLWREVLTRPRVAPLASKTLAENLPTSQSLPGALQAQIALLLGLYVVIVRWTLNRFGAVRGGWVVVVTLVIVSGALLYGSAVIARESASALVQISLIEAIPDVALAQVTTYAAVLPPYGGAFQLVAPAGATIRQLGRSTLNVFGGPVEIADRAPLEGVRFELQQVLPLAVRGVTKLTADGLRVEIENLSGLVIHEPSIYLNGESYTLPAINAHLVAVLDPTKWEPADRLAARADELQRRVRQWTFVRFGSDVIIKGDQPSLVGWVDDARLAVRSQHVFRGTTLHLLVVPLDSH